MPAVTTKLDRTKHDMRKGMKTGWPVSARCQHLFYKSLWRFARTWMQRRVYCLLRFPQVRRHVPQLARFIRRDELFRIFEASRGREECSVRRIVSN